MRVFLTGATGALGRRLVPQLIDRGHTVVGSVHSPHKAGLLRAQGGQPVVLDLLDPGAVLNVVRAIQPDAIVHQATALANVHDLRNADRAFAATNELRTRGTDALLVAAEEVGVPRFVAQSYAGWPYARQGGPIKTEDDPLDPRPPAKIRKTLAAIRHLEHAVVEAGGLALRYGSFYGSRGDGLLAAVRRRQLPLIGRAGGFWSFIHLDDAATATVLALERGDAGVYNVVDDHPAPVRSWLPALAAAAGARPPRHVPLWLARLLAGEVPVMLMTQSRGASNAKAKHELGWAPSHPSWRSGFAESYGRWVSGRGGALPSVGVFQPHDVV